jgi:carboxylesterase type B
MSNALSYSNSVVQHVNCTNEEKEKVLACLRNSSIETLFQAYGSRYTRPIIDSYLFPFYPPLAIQNGIYNNISLIMGNNDYEQPICFQHSDMNYGDALALISQSIAQKWIPSVVDYYHLNNCSSDRNANESRCCNIARLILMDKIFDCDIRRIFDAFYAKYGPQFGNDKLFSYHINCYPQCPVVPNKGICQHGSEQAYVFGTISDWASVKSINCTWDDQSRVFSNEIIAHWINTARTGRPLSTWPSYDPSAPKYFHITPDQGFLPETWNRNCSFFDEIEAEGVEATFGKSHYSIRKTST